MWQTHATVAPENTATAPELATMPTRKLVSHAGVDAADQATVYGALASIGGTRTSLTQHLVVSVDQPEDFLLKVSDLYPLPAGARDPAASKLVVYRSAAMGSHSAECASGTDAVATGCVMMTPTVAGKAPLDTPLFDVSTKRYSCSQGAGNCNHTVGLWQVWVADTSDELIILGDLSAYVSLSGYRFRLPASTSPSNVASNDLIAVGQPGEQVAVTYLRKTATKWIVHEQVVAVGATGRTEFTLA